MNTNTCRIRILIVEDNPDVCHSLEALCRKQGWLSRTVKWPQDEAQVLAEAREFRPHAAIIDMRLIESDTSNRQGFEYIPKLQPARCVVYSGYLTPPAVREAFIEAGAVDVIEKTASARELLTALRRAVRASCTCVNAPFKVEWPEGKSAEEMFRIIYEDANAPWDQILDVMGRLFYDEDRSSQSTQRIATDWFSAPVNASAHRHSTIIKAWRDGEAALLVKFGARERIKNEARKFREVRGRLTGGRFANLEKSVEWWDIGAVAYRILGADLRRVTSFEEFYRDTDHHDLDHLDSALNDLFEVLRPLHNMRRPSRFVDLFDAYETILNGKKKKLSALLSDKIWPPLEMKHLPNPVNWCIINQRRYRVEGLQEAYIHGDLHANNILVDESHRVWLIDFERSGFGPQLLDHAELTVDVLTRLFPYHEPLQAYYQLVLEATTEDLEQVIIHRTSDGAIQKAVRVVRAIRNMARRTGRYREWLWGLLLDSLFVIQVFRGREDERTKRAWLLAAVCAARIEGLSVPDSVTMI